MSIISVFTISRGIPVSSKTHDFPHLIFLREIRKRLEIQSPPFLELKSTSSDTVRSM